MEYFDLRTIMNEHSEEYYENMAKCIDGRMPKDIAEIILKEKSNPDYVLLCHRTCEVEPEELFKNGLICTAGNDISLTMDGYDSDGVPKGRRELNDCDFISGIFTNLAHKPPATRCIIIKLPKSALEYIPGESKPILFNTEEIATRDRDFIVDSSETKKILLPEYILGSVEFDNQESFLENNTPKKATEFIYNPNYKDEHDYQNDGLVCTQQLIWDYRMEKNIHVAFDPFDPADKLAYNKLNEEINSKISEENKEYMERNVTRSETELKEFSKKDMILSKFNQMAEKIKSFYTRDKSKEEKQDVDREQ